MLIKDLRSKNIKELNLLIEDLKAELFMLRFKNSTSQLDQPHKIKNVKKDIARVYTVIYEKNNNINYVSKIITKNKNNKIDNENIVVKEELINKKEVKNQNIKHNKEEK